MDCHTTWVCIGGHKEHPGHPWRQPWPHTHGFSKYPLPTVFLRNKHEGNLLLEDVDQEQSELVIELSNINKGGKSDKKVFYKKRGIFS